jgi:GTP-sensing pleiotropic transcriptional regulator CodY
MANEPQQWLMPPERDDENGRFSESYPAEKMFEAVEGSEAGATTSDVAKTVGSSRRLALRKLRTLEEEGRVRPREVGNTYLWVVDNNE